MSYRFCRTLAAVLLCLFPLFASAQSGYTATRHQREVGTGYFDLVAQTVSGGMASTVALAGSTEADQFKDKVAA